jgi:hypothetical protein
MNAKTEHWESYVDDAGRRHWRWPAAPQAEDHRGLPAPRAAVSLPRQRDLPLLPLFLRGK